MFVFIYIEGNQIILPPRLIFEIIMEFKVLVCQSFLYWSEFMVGVFFSFSRL